MQTVAVAAAAPKHLIHASDILCFSLLHILGVSRNENEQQHVVKCLCGGVVVCVTGIWLLCLWVLLNTTNKCNNANTMGHQDNTKTTGATTTTTTTQFVGCMVNVSDRLQK